MPETYASHSEIWTAVVEGDTDQACALLVSDFQESFGPIYNELLRRHEETHGPPLANPAAAPSAAGST
jgi:hypothetical protein